MYYIQCFLYGKPVTVESYETKTIAQNRQKEAIKSNCYEKVVLECNIAAKNVFDYTLNCCR